MSARAQAPRSGSRCAHRGTLLDAPRALHGCGKIGGCRATPTPTAAASTTRRASGARPPRRSTGSTPPPRVLDADAAPLYRWFTGGELNTCHNALDRHVDGGRGDQPALIYDSPVTDTVTVFTLRRAARRRSSRLAGALRNLGVHHGDRVVIYMPMVPEAVMAMLACARLGAIHSVVFGGFAPHELAAADRRRARRTSSCRRPAGSRARRSSPYKPLLDRAHRARRARADAHRDPPAPAGRGRADRRARPRLGDADRRRVAAPVRPGRGDRSALRPLHVGHDREAEGRRARQRRPRRRAALVDGARSTTPVPARSSGRPPTSAGSSATRTSSTRRCSPARRPSSTRASRSARPTPARSGA